MTRVLYMLMAGGRPAYWRDVGDISSYWRSQMELLDSRFAFLMQPGPGCDGYPLSDRALVRRYSSWRKCITNSLVSDRASIGAATINRSVIAPGACVAGGARVERSVVLDGAIVREGAVVDSRVVFPETEALADDRDSTRIIQRRMQPSLLVSHARAERAKAGF